MQLNSYSANAGTMAENPIEDAKNKSYRASTMTGLASLKKRLIKKYDERKDQESKSEDFIKEKIKLHNDARTDAYGEIEFAGNASYPAKYVKVGHETKPKIIYKLLTDHWELKAPSLIISVTGGAKNFNLRTRLKTVFRKSLIKAAESTGAWITTGGTHAGVMKHVGKAVKNYDEIKRHEQGVVAIGIASWGVIHGSDKLLNDAEKQESEKQKKPKVYNADERSQGKKVILDHNHSHYILVDDGKNVENMDIEYGGEIKFRTDFESYLSEQKTPDGVKVMVVCVLLQGGPGSLETVAESIKNGTPTVIVGGSGGWANVLTSVYNRPKGAKLVNEEDVKELMEENDMNPKPQLMQKWTNMVNTCVSDENLMSVFELDPTDSTKGLDIAILRALLKASKKQAYEQLSLAMAWNRSDIVESEILKDDAFVEKNKIADLFFVALEKNKHEFCKVFLDYEVDLKEYCTVKKLETLYKAAPCDSFIYKKVMKDEFSIKKVGSILVKLLGSNYRNVYEKRKPSSTDYEAIIEEVKDSNRTKKWLKKTWNTKSKIDDPYRELFQWAILVNYKEIAVHIWEYMSESMPAAIMATKIIKALAGKKSHDHEKKSLMMADANKYERLAAGILDKCFTDNPDQTAYLLLSKLEKWGGYTCLHVAAEAKDKHFVSRPGVQDLLDIIWESELKNIKWKPRKFTRIGCDDSKVVENENYKDKKSDPEIGSTNFTSIQDSRHDSILPDPTEKVTSQSDVRQRPESYNSVQKFIILLNAPITIFYMNVASFLVYLVLFAYVILSAFKISTVCVAISEYVLLGWITTFLLEEFREFMDQEARVFIEKLKLHIFDAWNIMDLTSLILFYFGFGFRYYEQHLQTSLVLYCLAFMTHCIRVVHIFAVHHILGPKIIMVGKMLKDLLFFLFILIVFLLAYGVASQALLYPEETNFGQIIVGILYRPYWQIYGELFLDEINYNPNVDGFACSNSANSSLPKCPQQSTIVPIISAIYLLLANVLLLNLLIAMFSYTFEKVERQSNEIWKFQRYYLIKYYYRRSWLVPPFIVLSHIYRLCLCIFRRIVKKLQNQENQDSFHYVLEMEPEGFAGKLWKWEHWHAEAYIHEKRTEDNDKVEKRLEKLGSRIDNITSTLEDMRNRSSEQGSNNKEKN